MNKELEYMEILATLQGSTDAIILAFNKDKIDKYTSYLVERLKEAVRQSEKATKQLIKN